MKIRLDYVTNSSSSSYIIGKKDDNLTIEDVYQKVRNAFIRYYEMGQELRECISKYDGPFKMVKKSYGWCVEYTKKGVKWETSRKDEEALQKALPTEIAPYIFDYFPVELDKWVMAYPTYDDFCKEYEEGKAPAPKLCMQIFDYTKPTACDWVYEDISKMSEEEIDERRISLYKGYDFYETASNIESEVLGWYMGYIEEAFRRSNPEKYKGIVASNMIFDEAFKQNCGYKTVEEIEQEKVEFDAIVERIQKEDIKPESACLYLLGKYCVFSEDCFIPTVVADILSEQSNYSCNHMG